MFSSRLVGLFMTVLLGIAAVTLATSPSAFGDTFPGVPGSTDGLCTVTTGVTTCIVNEGQGDNLIEEVINMTAVPILINSILPGPILFVGGDNTDVITSDPISGDACTGQVLAPTGFCFFTQSFTTGTPGDPDDGTIIPQDGESTMSFVLTFTPAAIIVGPIPVFVGQQASIFGPATPNPDGSFTAIIESADVKVNDVPEPSGLLLLASALLGIGGIYKKVRG